MLSDEGTKPLLLASMLLPNTSQAPGGGRGCHSLAWTAAFPPQALPLT